MFDTISRGFAYKPTYENEIVCCLQSN